jgi:hypothetical protein
MNERIKELALQANLEFTYDPTETPMRIFVEGWEDELNKFAELIIQGCIDKIETYRIPVGNSASGELACEWTYAALREIRDDIKESFEIL